MNIIQYLIPVGNTKTRPGIRMTPRYITIHETDNTNAGANAWAHAKLQARGNDRTASWHLSIDDKECYQSVPYNEVAYAAGDGKGPGNMSSIHIEMCVNSDGNYNKTIQNTVEVVKYLMDKFNIPLSNVVQHNKWSGKNCPSIMRSGKTGNTWNTFVALFSNNNGWKLSNGKWYFYENNKLKTGWVKDKGSWYFLDSNGIMKTGWVLDNNKWYYLAASGNMLTGWLLDKNKWYYLNADGAMQTGYLTLNGKKYFLDNNGVMLKTNDKGEII